jgi:hypothetical protein
MEVSLKKRMLAVFPMLLFVLFGFCLMGLTFLGAKDYEGLAKKRDAYFQETTCADYIRTKIGDFDSLDQVAVGEFADSDAIYLYETYQEQSYETILYIKDGYLYEQFQNTGDNISAGAGNKIMEAEEWNVTMTDENLLCCKVKQDGTWQEVHVAVQCGVKELE